MDQNKLARRDGALALLGALAFISTFLPWWTWHVIVGPTEDLHIAVTAWDQASNAYLTSSTRGASVNGPLAWMPMVMLLAFGFTALVRTGYPQLLPGRLFYQVGIGVSVLACSYPAQVDISPETRARSPQSRLSRRPRRSGRTPPDGRRTAPRAAAPP